ncbi:MAG: tyrosine--tRNA ligase [Dehalococcoidales bacterium]|jgi:tyrosyl-tRNA synthetase|nr:tyrosine--tRNA ligase [Dehalococcoidales bacterium]MDP6222026.1 tyrosine--tRNA ligase [Dehalococcoidales bacterium]MDP7109607.1 tyrosine--tRNA ligase [Dehalococcoidales bacterium]MDP7309528.1 tyrosine--tRNA ligase [Dehalococcoidales bacterium]MDP7409539.1 tyrosine--tRNA ligase [Dehalococcoidales bacterium]
MKRDISYLLKRGVSEVIVQEELTELLRSGKKLRLKEGFDPSFPDIHLGHMVGLRKLRQFQELGHQLVLIVGDWTAQIGDPSGASVTRPILSSEQVEANAQTYMEQFFKIVDQNKTEVRWQSEWFGKFDLADVIRLTSKFTVAQFLSRDDFNKRFMAGKPITITELLYPLLQAYDSVAIQADVEFGGIDQKFNFLVGRELQVMMGQLPQQCFMTPLLVGTDGSHKMSKSLDNYIGITEPPTEIYGKIMSIPDSLMMDYFELLTDIPDKELNKLRQVLNTETINPMELKKRLAREIITQLYDKKAASEAEEYFEKVFQRRELPDQIEEFPLDLVGKDVSPGDVDVADVHIPRLLVKIGLAKSLREANRLIAQGAVSIKGLTRENGEKILSNTANIFTGDIIKVGNRRFARIGGEVMIMPPDPED